MIALAFGDNATMPIAQNTNQQQKVCARYIHPTPPIPFGFHPSPGDLSVVNEFREVQQAGSDLVRSRPDEVCGQ